MSGELFNKIEIKQFQRLQLNPQLLQSMAVLCMGNAELVSYIDKLYQENPCIEKSDPEIPEDMMRVLAQYRSSDYGNAHGDHSVNPPGEERRDIHNAHEPSGRYVDDYIESLSYSLKSQLEKKHLEKSLSAVCFYLVDLLEDNGRLLTESIDSVRKIGVPGGLLSEAVEVIKSLEPAGVGAADLSEFLRLQLERYYPEQTLAIRLAQPEFLNALAKQQYQAIANALDAEYEDILSAAELIRSLNTDISAGFSEKEETVFIHPDLYIYLDEEGAIHTAANEYDMPKVGISGKYLEMYKNTDDPELREYLKQKLSETYRLISCIGRRRSTLGKCFDYIVEEQQAFFKGETDKLKPMTMSEAASALGVHVSTVSRCMMNKYVQSPAGLFPAKYFFSRALKPGDPADRGSDGPRSAQGAKAELIRLIEQEDSRHPRSDAVLSRLLKEQGYPVERRTVAKYRNELRIPDYRIRKSKYYGRKQKDRQK